MSRKRYVGIINNIFYLFIFSLIIRLGEHSVQMTGTQTVDMPKKLSLICVLFTEIFIIIKKL